MSRVNINDANAWKQIGQDIVSDADDDCNDFGYYFSLSGDGKTIAVGTRYANGMKGEYSGIVRIYRVDDAKTNWI